MLFAASIRLTASFPDALAAADVLRAWRNAGPESARHALQVVLEEEHSLLTRSSCRLLLELQLRLSMIPGPRLLVDGFGSVGHMVALVVFGSKYLHLALTGTSS